MRLFLLLIIVIISSCTKPIFDQKQPPVIAIKGQIFESRSNPLPVANYSLLIGQGHTHPIGLIGDLDTIKTSDKEGRFVFYYKDYDEYAIKSINQQYYGELGQLSITAWDESKQNRMISEWLGFESLKNYNIDSLFLYKSIQKAVRKVRFKNALATGDTLEVITSNAHTAEYKTIYGPVAAGSFLTIDTLKNLRITVYHLALNTYILRSALKKTGYQTNHDIDVGLRDETNREIIMTY